MLYKDDEPLYLITNRITSLSLYCSCGCKSHFYKEQTMNAPQCHQQVLSISLALASSATGMNFAFFE